MPANLSINVIFYCFLLGLDRSAMAKCSTVSTSTDLSNATFSNSTGEYAHVYLCLIIPSTATIEGEIPSMVYALANSVHVP